MDLGLKSKLMGGQTNSRKERKVLALALFLEIETTRNGSVRSCVILNSTVYCF